MPISTMLKRLSSRSSSRASTRTWPTISPAVRLRIDAHLAGQAERARHRAADLRRQAERVRAGVSGMKTDSISLPSCSRSRNFVVPSVELLLRDDRRRADAETACQVARSSRPRSVIFAEIGDAVAVDPLEDLARVKARASEGLECLLRAPEAPVPRCRWLSMHEASLKVNPMDDFVVRAIADDSRA